MSTQSNALPISRMRIDDSAATSELIREVVQSCDYYNAWAKADEIAKYPVEKLIELVVDDPRSVLVAGPRERPVGFCINHVDGGVIWLAWIGVRNEARRQGVARAMLDELIQSAPSRRCHKIWCDCRVSNVESARTLERAGFQRLCELRNHWNGQDFYLWERPISVAPPSAPVR